MDDLEGRVFVVTGGSSGQGAAQTAALCSAGAQVVVADRQAPLSALPPAATHVPTDVGRPQDWHVLVDHVRSRHGRVDGLVNGAGVAHSAGLQEVSVEDWDRVFRVNVTGALLAMQALVPLMGRGGSIVNVSSLAARTGFPAAAYTSSKWAIRGLSRAASVELARQGIRVNLLLPGWIDTPMNQGAPDALRASMLETVPLARHGTVDDVTPLVLFLLSARSRWITGAEINVDGGAGAAAGVSLKPGGISLTRSDQGR